MKAASKAEEVIITPKKREPVLRGLIKRRELVYFFVWREFKLRYKHAHLGILWAILEPLLFMVLVHFIIVQRLGAKFGGGDEVLSALLIFLGFILWQTFGPSFVGTANSFIGNQALFNKLYFPKVLPAIAAIVSRAVDFGIAFGLLIAMGLLFDRPMPFLTMLLAIPGLLVLMLSAYGAGLFLGTLSVKYRDLKHTLPLLSRVLWFGSPVIWPLTIVPESIRPWFYLNPAAAVIETMRESWYDPSIIRWDLLILPFITMTVLLILGVWVFKRNEREMIDIV